MNIVQGIKAKMLMLVLGLAISFLLAACGDVKDSEDKTRSESKSTSTITISGATSILQLAQDLSDKYKEMKADISVEVQEKESSLGIIDVNDGKSDIGASSRDLTTEEKSFGLAEHIIAYDGIAVVVHPSNPVTNLSKEQISKIFKGEIKNWKNVGGTDSEILVITRESSSDTRAIFEELLGIQETKDGQLLLHLTPDALVADGTGAVKANVASKENAIGYISLGYVNNTMKKVSIDNAECTSDSIKSKAYLLSRPFVMLTKGDTNTEAKAFIDYILSDKGQEIIGENYVKAN